MNYSCQLYNRDLEFDAELVETVVAKMKRGKAAGLDSITAEHLQYSHPVLSCVFINTVQYYGQTGSCPT